MPKRPSFFFILLPITLLGTITLLGQPVTGVWRGKVTRSNGLFTTTYKLELKLVKKGDSLLGTSYYYASPSNYYRYRVRGVYNGTDASLHWWDEELLESKSGNGPRLGGVNQQPLNAIADFNCPGSGIMKLDGTAGEKGNTEGCEMHLDKMGNPIFRDQWDMIIDNWLVGGAHPDLIDAVAIEEGVPKVVPKDTPSPPVTSGSTAKKTTLPGKPEAIAKSEVLAKAEPVVASKPSAAAKAPTTPQTITQKFETRERKEVVELPLEGDVVELQFFDNAEIDGDSISLFLNGRLIFEHVRLAANAFSVKLPVEELDADNELAMVAENLGEIPPNTSFMIAYVNGIRYTTRLESTEHTTAVIRLRKPARLQGGRSGEQ